jgi:hypothetical protein
MVAKPNDVTTFGGEALFKNEPKGEEIVDQPTVILTGIENQNDEEVAVPAIDEPTMILTPVEEEAKKAAAEITTNNQESLLAPPPLEPQQPKNEMPPPKIINSIEHNLITPLNDTNISVMSNERDQFDGRLPNARDLLGTSFANQNDSSNILFF